MTAGDDEQDRRIARLLGSVRADADPALWTRARARIESRERAAARGWLGWLMRPAALGGSLALLAAAVATSAVLVITAPRSTSTSGSADTLEDALVAELESFAATTAAAGTAAPRVTADSGASR